MKKMIDKTYIEGYLYEHDLTLKVTGPNSKAPGTPFIGGSISIATDNALLNVVKVDFTYVTETTRKGGVNNTYVTLKNIIDGVFGTVMKDGKDRAVKLRVDSAIGLNDFYTESRNNPGELELVSAKRNEGGFVHVVSGELTEDEDSRNTFECDIVITNVAHKEADEERDIPFCKTEEDWIAFGQADARAVAKYFGLSSASLGIDYSEEANFLPEADENSRVQLTARDETEPDVCLIELLSADYDTGAVQIQVTAADYDSPLIYYDYSIDGGVTYCPLTPWPNTDVLEGTYTDTFTLQLQIESGIQPEIIVRAYNLADLDTESNLLPFLQAFYYGEEETVTETEEDNNTQTSVERERHSAGTTTFMPANADTDEVAQDGEVSILTFLKICLIFVVILFGIVLTYQAIVYNKRKKRRRQRMKDLGNNRNHPR